MLKSILNLEGAQQLTTDAQKEITGGKPYPWQLCIDCDNGDRICPTGYTWKAPITGSEGYGSCCPNRI